MQSLVTMPPGLSSPAFDLHRVRSSAERTSVMALLVRSF
jgi:hypothetical protein